MEAIAEEIEQVEETCSERRRRLRAERLRDLAEGLVWPFSRHYGGPEDGGWWYDRTTVQEVRKAWDWRTAMKHVRELREEHPTCPRGRFSVIGGTDMYVQTFRTLEDLPEENFERPRYE
jgi:hypothetical protein